VKAMAFSEEFIFLSLGDVLEDVFDAKFGLRSCFSSLLWPFSS